MPFNVVSINPTNILDVWEEYRESRGLDEKALLPLLKYFNAELMPMGNALIQRIPTVNGLRGDGCLGAFVYELEPGQWRGRAFYGPHKDVAPPGGYRKVPKYIGPSNSISLLYMSPIWDDWFTAKEPYHLLIVEGVLNAARLNAEGIRAVGIPGVFNFQIKGKNTPMITNLQRLLKSDAVGRVTVMFDSDTRTPEDNPQLWSQTNTFLLEILKQRKGREHTVYQCSPPPKQDGSKCGPDDFLHEEGPIEFNKLLQESRVFADNPWFVLERKVTAKFVYDRLSNKMWATDERVLMPREHANSVMMTMGQELDITSLRPKRVPYTWDHYLTSPYARLAYGAQFNPLTDEVFFLDDKVIPPVHRINRHNPNDVPEAIPGDISLAFWAMNNVCRDDPSAVQKMLIVAAYHAQNPALAPKYALLFVGDKGSGKSNLARLFGLALSKRYHSDKIDSNSPYNGEWRGFPCKEWPEYDAKMDEEWLKSLVTDEKYLYNPKYGGQSTEYNHTLNIFTSNTLQSRIQEGDRRFLICGYAKAEDKSRGLQFEAWINGTGPNHFRHFLLDFDCSGYHYLEVATKVRDSVINASKSYKRTVWDEFYEAIIEVDGMDIFPNNLTAMFIEQYRINIISFNKENAQVFTPVGLPQVKIDGSLTRFRCFRNPEKWAKETDTDKYREQYKLAAQFMQSIMGTRKY